MILVTHYQRLLDYIKPDHVHVLAWGKIVKSGGRENLVLIGRLIGRGGEPAGQGGDGSRAEDDSRNLMYASHFSALLKASHQALRQVCARAALHGLPVPALSSGLAYFDTMRTARGTANMIQGQRDYFGRHGFERFDREEAGQHGPWAD